jgi:hypothetical protein
LLPASGGVTGYTKGNNPPALDPQLPGIYQRLGIRPGGVPLGEVN